MTRFAKRDGYAIVEEFYDAAVSGADPITERPGFTAMLERIVGNGVRVILVETASRFACSVLSQEVGFGHLQGLGVTLIAVDSPELFLSQEPMMVALRQMQGVFSQLDKATLMSPAAAPVTAARRWRAWSGRLSHETPDTLLTDINGGNFACRLWRGQRLCGFARIVRRIERASASASRRGIKEQKIGLK